MPCDYMRLHASTINYPTYAHADLERQLRARELRNGQSEEGQRQASAIMAQDFAVDVPQFWCYQVRRDGKYEKRNGQQKPARVHGNPRIPGHNSFLCNR